MKALTIRQPWATLIAIGAKRVETRSWPTKYRGPVAIHASRWWSTELDSLVHEHPFWDHLFCRQIVCGAILATANIVDCIVSDRYSRQSFSHTEIAFGDFANGRYLWMLADVSALKKPIPCKGALGLWNLPADIEEKVRTA